jgi:hypothetical protein
MKTIRGVWVLVCAALLGGCGESPEEAAAREKAAAEKEAACKADLQCLGDRLGVAAAVHCVNPVEKMAKNSMRWTDETLEPKFSHFRWGPSKQSVTMIGDKAQFQNGFGAHVNVVYECDLSPDGERVLDVRVREGRL